MIFTILVLIYEVGQSLNRLWPPQHKVAFYHNEDIPGAGMKMYTPLFIFLWALVQRQAFILPYPFSCLLPNKISSSTYLCSLDKVLIPSQCICQGGNFTFNKGKLDPSREQSIEKDSVGYPILQICN